MRRIGSSPFAFPEFRGATRTLVFVNLATYFAFLLVQVASQGTAGALYARFTLDPFTFFHGWLWQPFTYSFIHVGIVSTLFELLSLWFLAGFLEQMNTARWVNSLYAVSVLGTAAAALALYAVGVTAAPVLLAGSGALYGCFGGIFGMLIAIGVLYGDMEFLLFFTIGIKARYMAVLYGLIAVAMLFGQERVYAFAQLGGALAGWLYVRTAGRRGIGLAVSERWYGMRNAYYRWKRRRAARKFEVYMRSQGRTVHFDGSGRQIDDEDKKRWN